MESVNVSAQGNAQAVSSWWTLPVTKRKSCALGSTAYSGVATGDLVLQC
jgi:hypothetical protein